MENNRDVAETIKHIKGVIVYLMLDPIMNSTEISKELNKLDKVIKFLETNEETE